MATTLNRPWEALPPAVAGVLRPELPALADEIVTAVREGVPEYSGSIEGRFGAGLRAGVEEALRQFVEMIGSTAPLPGPGREVYVALGRGEMRAGRPLDALLSAYRVGARVA
nr:PucR family transcriptional regulator [Actinomycetota bacterium]